MSTIEYIPETGKIYRKYQNGKQRETTTFIHTYKNSTRPRKYAYFVDTSSGKRKIILVHRYAWIKYHGDIPKHMVVDHINNDSMDNRLCNLRLATKSQNALNAKNKLYSTNSSGHRGVSFQKGKYKAHIMINYKNISLGSYDTAEEAVDARLQYSKQHGV